MFFKGYENIKCVVTGGSGFIGSHIVQSLVESKADVTVIDNLSSGKIENIADSLEKITFVKADVTKDGILEKHLKTCDFVFHLAANPSVEYSVQHPAESLNTNFIATQKVIDAACANNVKKVVFSSSCAIYGQLTPPLTENMLPSPLSPYAVAKAASELALTSSSAIHPELKWTALRYFNVFGPRQDPFSPYGAVIPKFISAVLSGKSPKIFGDGLQTRDFVYVEQVVWANLLSALTPKTDGEIINIGNGQKISLIELLDVILQITGSDLKPIFENERKGDVKHSYADISKMLKLLGKYEQNTFREGILRTINWYRETA